MSKSYRAGLYCRLSVDDANNSAKARNYIPADESTSIENQREPLSKFAMLNGWVETRTYVDDGYSGGNFQRPGSRCFTVLLDWSSKSKYNNVSLSNFRTSLSKKRFRRLSDMPSIQYKNYFVQYDVVDGKIVVRCATADWNFTCSYGGQVFDSLDDLKKYIDGGD